MMDPQNRKTKFISGLFVQLKRVYIACGKSSSRRLLCFMFVLFHFFLLKSNSDVSTVSYFLTHRLTAEPRIASFLFV